jgi:hypothetical protein
MPHELATAIRQFMAEDRQELERLERRIADVRRCIEQARDHHGWPGDVSEKDRMLALLNATLRALEARKAAVDGAGQ